MIRLLAHSRFRAPAEDSSCLPYISPTSRRLSTFGVRAHHLPMEWSCPRLLGRWPRSMPCWSITTNQRRMKSACPPRRVLHGWSGTDPRPTRLALPSVPPVRVTQCAKAAVGPLKKCRSGPRWRQCKSVPPGIALLRRVPPGVLINMLSGRVQKPTPRQFAPSGIAS